ncbi:hypothetical protein [Nostoc sp. 'Peltigera membranacea cyanobiont' 232]|nr:hypothetical protein [Nostoc sp. 'Peltigera membranacea cyanobiont' 232]
MMIYPVIVCLLSLSVCEALALYAYRRRSHFVPTGGTRTVKLQQ